MAKARMKSVRFATATASFQYDYGQELQVSGMGEDRSVEVQFAREGSGEAIARLGEISEGVLTVRIPDDLLSADEKEDYNIFAYVVITDETSGTTKCAIRIPVLAREKPADEIGEDSEKIDVIAEIITKLNRIIESGVGESGREIELQKSEAAIQWRYDGEEEWTDLVLLEDLRGADGLPGKDGYTPVKGIDYFDGEKGEKGDPGEIPDVSSFAKKSDIPSALPNPCKLTISYGGATYEYDGSSDVTITIANGDEVTY